MSDEQFEPQVEATQVRGLAFPVRELECELPDVRGPGVDVLSSDPRGFALIGLAAVRDVQSRERAARGRLVAQERRGKLSDPELFVF